MWKQNEAMTPGAPAPSSSAPTATAPATRTGSALIGQSVVVKGELTGSENLRIEGRIEGKIELQQHTVTIGEHAQVQAEIIAREVIVLGKVTGNITANERIDVREPGQVEGDIVSPAVAIAHGAKFRGGIDMPQEPTRAARPPVSASATAPLPSDAERPQRIPA